MIIHVFVDCQPAIISAFCTEIPKHNVGVILNIRHILYLQPYRITVTACPGHKDLKKGNELICSLAKTATKEMIGKKEDFLSGMQTDQY